VNYKEIKELIELIRETDVCELEVERAGTRIRLRRECRDSAPTVIREVQSMPALQEKPIAAAPPVAGSEAAGELDEAGVVRSPLVGTYYSAAGPDSRPFVEVGDRVEKGQVLCIVEAMKLMNEIEAEYAGVVREIYAENSHPVEYGQPLFRIEADA
jgi:acetyl-CoA carboxylase biotin carboxyl carrier protein